MDFRKQAKESRTKKLHQLTVSAPDAKTDASDFTPYADPNMDKKTGKRPINPRNFKRGGKVTALDGDKAQKRGDRVGAKGRSKKMLGGDITAGGNAQIPSAKGQTSLLRKAVGLDYKSGGRAKKAYGGRGVGERTQMEEARRAAVKAGEDYGVDSRVSEDDLRKATRNFEQKKTETAYKKGGRTKKADGGGKMRSERTEQAIADRKSMDSIERKEPLNIQRYLYNKSGETGKQTGYSSFGEKEEMRRGGRAKKMNGGPMMAGPAQTMMKRKMPMNNPAAKAPAVMPMRAKGGKVSEMEWEHSKKDLAEDKKLAKKHGMSLEKWEKSAADKKHDKQQSTKGLMCGGRTKKDDGGGAGMRSESTESAKANRKVMDAYARSKAADKEHKDALENVFKTSDESARTINQGGYGDEYFAKKKNGGRTKRATGGRAKGKSNINIVIAPQPAAQGPMPMGGMPPRPPMPMPMPPAPGGMPPGAMPPGAGGMPMPIPMPMAGGAPAPAPQGAGVPGLPGMAPLPRKSGGRVKSFKDMTAGAGSGEGRLQKEEMQEYKRTARKAGGKVPNMTFGAGSGPGRIEKIHAYGENPHGEAAPKPKKRSWTM